ncbi:MAG: translocase [Acidobacteria bacterium]|nr:MAG: translocase [Acidobacteriota bacterium]
MTNPTEPTLGERAGSEKSWLDKSLSIFTDVRAGEGTGALLLAANVFSLLAFYSVLKVVREALILSEGGAVVKSYAAAGQAVLLLAFVPAYGAFASRVNRLRLVCGVTLFFATHLIVFYLLGSAGVRVGVAFYLWIGIFNLVVIAQFWGFANDLYSPERGKRLFPCVGLGASLGAAVGSGLTVALAEVGAYRLMLVAAVGLLIPVLLTLWVNRRESRLQPHKQASGEEPLSKEGGFKLVLSQRYLLLIALLMVVLNLVNTLGEFQLGSLIESEAVHQVQPNASSPSALTPTERESARLAITHMAGTVQTSVNILGLIFQAFLVSRVFKYLGVRGAIFILPFIALGSYGLIALFPIFSIVRVAKVLENSTDYSIQNTARQALFLPTSREAKYKAKQAIDSFFVRAGDMLQAGVVFVGVQLALGIRQYALVNVVLVGVWLLLAVGIAREHKKLVPLEAEKVAA